MGDWAPFPEDPLKEAPAPLRLVVDGEQFDVRERPGRPGQYDFDWISGPNDGYGFSSAWSDRDPHTRTELEDAIRDFLAQVDPEIGFIE